MKIGFLVIGVVLFSASAWAQPLHAKPKHKAMCEIYEYVPCDPMMPSDNPDDPTCKIDKDGKAYERVGDQPIKVVDCDSLVDHIEAVSAKAPQGNGTRSAHSDRHGLKCAGEANCMNREAAREAGMSYQEFTGIKSSSSGSADLH